MASVIVAIVDRQAEHQRFNANWLKSVCRFDSHTGFASEPLNLAAFRSALFPTSSASSNDSDEIRQIEYFIRRVQAIALVN